jgi:hypothetical protein
MRWKEELGPYSDYLAEKTTPTIVQWLAGKQCLFHYDLVPIYALDAFEKYLEDGGAPVVMKSLLQMSAGKHLEAMQKALTAIATIKWLEPMTN